MESASRCCRDAYTYPVTRQKAFIIGGAIAVVVLLVVIIVVVSSGDDERPAPRKVTGRDALKSAPLVIGRNNLAANLKDKLKNRIKSFDFLNATKNTATIPGCTKCATDLNTLALGMVALQGLTVSVECAAQSKDAVTLALEQMDVIRRLVNTYPTHMAFVSDSDDVQTLSASKKLGAFIGINGGHVIDSRMAVLRMLYDAGARYMSLTGDAAGCDTYWATGWDHPLPTAGAAEAGLSAFGKSVVEEMNRLGMVVDLSSSSRQTQADALFQSKAPVIFSSSNAFKKCAVARNVNDDVLAKLKANAGLIMVSFDPALVKVNSTAAPANTTDLLEHFEYLKTTVGVDQIGIGANFDSYDKKMADMADASAIPALFDSLYNAGWPIADLEKIAGKNFLRVLKAVEDKAKELRRLSTSPDEQYILQADVPKEKLGCYSDWTERYTA